MPPRPAAPYFELADGAIALPPGLLFLRRTASLIVADAHLGYEDVVGGALPLWSTMETVAIVRESARGSGANEIVFLGDVIHGSRMSEGAAAEVRSALETLRSEFAVTLIAGNHEGRTRGAAVLGETVTAIERDGWLLIHGDKPVAARRCILGHLHPSISLGGGASTRAFLASRGAIVVPALTPYSNGLNVLSNACAAALRQFVAPGEPVDVTVCGDGIVYPFGSLEALKDLLRSDVL